MSEKVKNPKESQSPTINNQSEENISNIEEKGKYFESAWNIKRKNMWGQEYTAAKWFDHRPGDTEDKSYVNFILSKEKVEFYVARFENLDNDDYVSIGYCIKFFDKNNTLLSKKWFLLAHVEDDGPDWNDPNIITISPSNHFGAMPKGTTSATWHRHCFWSGSSPSDDEIAKRWESECSSSW